MVSKIIAVMAFVLYVSTDKFRSAVMLQMKLCIIVIHLIVFVSKYLTPQDISLFLSIWLNIHFFFNRPPANAAMTNVRSCNKSQRLTRRVSYEM
jgi:hypothetical protein